MPLDITVDILNAGSGVVSVHGSLTLGSNLKMVEGQVQQLIEEGVQKLVLDLTDCQYADSAGLGFLIHTYGLVSARGCRAMRTSRRAWASYRRAGRLGAGAEARSGRGLSGNWFLVKIQGVGHGRGGMSSSRESVLDRWWPLLVILFGLIFVSVLVSFKPVT